jgi:RNA polymerase sigma factor (TIGR02999 family)
MPLAEPEITRMLHAWRAGDEAALGDLTPVVYNELRRLASRQMRGERQALTLHTSALVNEAFLRLVSTPRVNWQNRAHFFAVCSQLMRRILVDFARERRAEKRGALAVHVPISEVEDELSSPVADVDLVALDEALNDLATLDPRRAQMVELRFFAGLSVEETAEALGISAPTVRRDWSVARAWLYRALARGQTAGEHLTP